MVGGVSSHDPVSVIHVESRKHKVHDKPKRSVLQQSRGRAATRQSGEAAGPSPGACGGWLLCSQPPGRVVGGGTPRRLHHCASARPPWAPKGGTEHRPRTRFQGADGRLRPASAPSVPSAPRRPLHVGEGLSSHLWVAGGGPDASCGTGATVPATNMLPPGSRAGCLHARTAHSRSPPASDVLPRLRSQGPRLPGDAPRGCRSHGRPQASACLLCA